MPDPLPPATAGSRQFTTVKWLIVVIAAIGFAFDIYELLMLPLIVRPALLDLEGIQPGTPAFADRVGMLFYIPAFAGGFFGLIGGYLTDMLGRRRILTWSILLYAVSAFLAGFSTSFTMLLVLRCTTFIGVCVEFVAAVAWLAELFPDHDQRENVLGYTQFFSSFGGMMVAGANGLAVAYSGSLPAVVIPDWLGFLGTIDPAHQHEAWRYTLMSGLIPAIPLILIRPFLPESPAWQAKKEAGTLKRPSIAELFAPGLLKTTVVTTVMFACSYGAAFGAIQQIPQIVPGLPEVKAETKAIPVTFKTDEAGGMIPATPQDRKNLGERRKIEQAQAASVTSAQEFGGLLGRLVLAVLAVRILSRRLLLRLFQVPGLVIVPLVFAYAAVTSLNLLYVGIFLAGFFTVAQFSFWGNYLPLVYPLHLRGTGESFAANIGGRMIGTSFAWVTSAIAVKSFVPGGDAPTKVAYVSAAVALLVYAVGIAASFFLPEPTKLDTPE